MFLTEARLPDIMMKQYKYKLNSYIGAFQSLMLTQLLGLLLSFSGTSSMSSGFSDSVDISIRFYTGDIIIAFTMVWAFLTGILLTTKAYRYDDFTFVTSRFTSNLSSMLFLATSSLIGAVTALLAGVLLKVIIHFTSDATPLGFQPLEDLHIGILAACFSLLLLSAAGYFIGMLVQIHKLVAFLLPVLFVGMLVIDAKNGSEEGILFHIASFFADSSLGVFGLKTLLGTAILYACSIVISNRLEVRS
ncbi:hypothetical protein [Bacillus marinisedimentorum]|uniref:hypothetical protein n=1 Tax=Bacillus marinisedimentorum TaxID=1821260 RepID=UPI0008728B6B|nr:hypothetical protein [Bacillus marinisedimentorum]